MWKCMRFWHVALCISTFSFNLSPPTFLSMISLSHKCIKLKEFGSTPFSNFLNSSTFNFINLKNDRFSPFNVSFHVLLYIPVSQNVKRPKEK